MYRMVSLCDSCAHLDTAADKSLPFPPSCNAFPEGIPREIWNGGDHREPWGDEIITYDMAPGKEDLLQTWLDRRDSESVDSEV